MEPVKPGWKTTEFWATITAQVVAMLVAFGVINPGSAAGVEAHVASAVAGVFALVALFSMVKRYIDSRTELKSKEAAPGSGTPLTPLLILLAFGLLLCWPSAALAQQPVKTSWLPWRDRVERDIRELRESQRQQPQQQNDQLMQALIASLNRPQAQPQIIILSPPRQDIPLGGPPRQEIPLGGPPRQDIPIGGPPKQDVPLGGPPKQELPLGGPPRQQIDPGRPGEQRQQIPIGEQRPLAPVPGEARPGQPSGFQRYQQALYRAKQ